MNAEVKIAPSILAADFAQLGNEITHMDKAGADWLHVDVMDGHFVPNLTIGPCVIAAIRRYTKKPLDVHLMIEPVDALLSAFIDAGADVVSFHPEATPDVAHTIATIKKLGARVGLVLNPQSPIDLVTPYLNNVHLVLQMSVQPGFGGQTFIETSPARIAALRRLLDSGDCDCELEVDGGITEETAKLAIAAGATVLVAGTSCFTGNNDQYADNIARLRHAVQ